MVGADCSGAGCASVGVFSSTGFASAWLGRVSVDVASCCAVVAVAVGAVANSVLKILMATPALAIVIALATSMRRIVIVI